MMKSCFFLFSTLLLTALPLSVMAETANFEGTSSQSKPTLSNLFPNAPAWASRIRGNASFSSDSSPSFGVETTQPLWQAENFSHHVFAQGRASYKSGDWTLNIGNGYRYLAPDATWLVGANVFYDTQVNDGHQRIGFGGEAMQSYLTLRTNYYQGMSGWRRTQTAPNYYIEERALDGYDAGLEGPVPYLPWARLFASYYRWDASLAPDIYGFETKLRADLTSNLSVDFGGSVDNQDYAIFTKISLSLGDPAPNRETFVTKKIADKAFTPRDLKTHVLDPVERHNDIVTERRTVASGSVTGVRVVIRRGN